MNSKSLAEAQRICDAGLGSYLAQKHSDFRMNSFSKGVIAGLVFALPTYFGLKTYTSINPSFAALPAFAGLVGGTYRGITSADQDDSLHTSDFNEVCDSLEEDEEAEEDEETSE